MAARRGPGKSANSAKPAIASINSSRSAMMRIVADDPFQWKAYARLTPHLRAAQHGGEVAGGSMTLARDRKSELLAGARLFDGVDADGMERIASVAVQVDFPADHV